MFSMGPLQYFIINSSISYLYTKCYVFRYVFIITYIPYLLYPFYYSYPITTCPRCSSRQLITLLKPFLSIIMIIIFIYIFYLPQKASSILLYDSHIILYLYVRTHYPSLKTFLLIPILLRFLLSFFISVMPIHIVSCFMLYLYLRKFF